MKFIDMLDMERIISVILSSCTLHEFCLDNSDSGEEYIPEGERDEEEINNFQYAFGVPLSAELTKLIKLKIIIGVTLSLQCVLKI